MIADYGHRFQHHWSAAMRAKIGLTGPDDADDLTLLRDLLSLMQAQAADFTLSFRSLASAIEPGGESDMLTLFKDHEPVLAWLQRWRARLTRDGVPEAERARAMRAVNPAFIPRNHRIEQAIAAAQTEADFSLFEALQAVLSHPYDDQPQLARFAEPPGAGEEVLKTFCGT